MRGIQPYENNAACDYQVMPLSDEEHSRIRRQAAVVAVAIALPCIGMLWVLLPAVIARDPSLSTSDYLTIPFVLALLVLVAVRLFERRGQKEVFTSELTQVIPSMSFLSRELRFRDSLDALWADKKAIAFRDIAVGSKYRVHRMASSSKILKMEKLSG